MEELKIKLGVVGFKGKKIKLQEKKARRNLKILIFNQNLNI